MIDCGSKIVLLVEDDQDNRAIYSALLKHAGYAVLEAPDGACAIALIKSRLPQLVLLDISLPVIDGWAVAAWMKGWALSCTIPILGLSAHAQREVRERAAGVGFAGYLTKPIEPREVLRQVQRLIGEPSAELQLRRAF